MIQLKDYIRDVPDFPKKGILFKDITPLLSNAKARRECLHILANSLKGQRIDKVVGAESRGFLFGILLAQELNAGFVCELIEKLGGEIVQFNFLMELSFLNGREKIKDYPIFSAVTY